MSTELSSSDKLHPGFDWASVARFVLLSRAIDDLTEQELYAKKNIAYQFSARGHTLSQVLLGTLLNDPHDAASAYYRSRPLLLSLGLAIDDAFAGPLGKTGGYSGGRDIGVVCNLLADSGTTVLPMAGDVGSQFTPAAGWAESIRYFHQELGDTSYQQSIAVAHGGDGSTATNGFWSALNICATRKLPMLFFIEDNGYAISVPSRHQTPGGNIAENLSGYRDLTILEGDGTEPADAAEVISKAVRTVREERGPVLLRLDVPRLCGHSGQDNQAYKSEEVLAAEQARDPLPKLEQYLVPGLYSPEEWSALSARVNREVALGLEKALERPDPTPDDIERYAFSELQADGSVEWQSAGGSRQKSRVSETNRLAQPEGLRLNFLECVRKTLEAELRANDRMLVFGEDVGLKGGVHTATMDLQEKFGEHRVFDTSLSEEGIIGRAVGMALAGLLPVPEIQFRKYADAATEQLNNCGTIRWRTTNRFAAPLVVRMPLGHSRRAGDPWHSVSGEAVWAHQVGWRIVIPSNAEDAVGLLRTALRGNDPVLFLEHRALLDAPSARRPYPGDEFALPFGEAACVQEGSDLTVVTWGAMVENCVEAVRELDASVEILDLRTICPWDREAVFASVRKTKRCAIVHEDTRTVGFGAEISAQLASELFFDLDAPIKRICPPDIPIPYNPILMNAVVPSESRIKQELQKILQF